MCSNQPPVCNRITVAVCVFRTVTVSNEPIHMVNPSWSALCKWNPSVGEYRFPQHSVHTPINTHQVRHISQRWPSYSSLNEGNEIYLSSTAPCDCFHVKESQWFLRRGFKAVCAWYTPLHVMKDGNLILLTNNHWSVIYEFKHWSISSESLLCVFVCTKSVNFIFLWLGMHPSVGEAHHPPTTTWEEAILLNGAHASLAMCVNAAWLWRLRSSHPFPLQHTHRHKKLPMH